VPTDPDASPDASPGAAGAPSAAGAEPAYCSYEEFGVDFFRRAVTLERVQQAVAALAEQPIDVGPVGVGPGRLVKVSATGGIGRTAVTPLPGPEVSFHVVLPVSLDVALDLGVETHRFHADLAVPLTLHARAMLPATVRLDLDPPTPDQVGLDLRAAGLRASVLQRVAGIEGEVKRFVARYVRRELDKPYVERARTIDVGAALDKAWASVPLAPATARSVADDFEDALEDELREHADG